MPAPDGDMPRDPQPTRERLLDTAERLFAQRGFHAVSIRDVTSAAKVDVSLVHYHFGSMRELLAEVIARRASFVNRVRLDALAAIQRERRPGVPSAEEVLHAFADPLWDLLGQADPGWNNYFALIAQVNNSPELARPLMTQHYNECVQRFIDALMDALPDSEPADIYWGYHFLSGALTITFADTGRIDELSHGLCRSSDVKEIYPRFAAFFAGGFDFLTRNRAAPPRGATIRKAKAKQPARAASGTGRKQRARTASARRRPSR
jgi:AcrR family transcriptional regulator